MRLEIEYGSYNPRRRSRPWGALVAFSAGKPQYDFKAGNFLGDEKGGKVYINCEPGDLIAHGQKDNRGNNSSNDIYVVEADGNLRMVDKPTAFAHWEARQTPASPLAHVSTEELIAELRRRNALDGN